MRPSVIKLDQGASDWVEAAEASELNRDVSRAMPARGVLFRELTGLAQSQIPHLTCTCSNSSRKYAVVCAEPA